MESIRGAGEPGCISIRVDGILTPVNARSDCRRVRFLPSPVSFGCGVVSTPHVCLEPQRNTFDLTLHIHGVYRRVTRSFAGQQGSESRSGAAANVSYSPNCRLRRPHLVIGRLRSDGLGRIHLLSVLIKNFTTSLRKGDCQGRKRVGFAQTYRTRARD